MMNIQPIAAVPVRTAGALHQNRVFLDFFWDLAKPDQDIRLRAVENLLKYLKDNNEEDELEYTLKKLVDGLAHTREAARPGFSLALGQLLTAFEDITLQNILDRIREKHNVQTATKKFVRNAAFGSLFGVLALHQSGRLFKEPPVVLGSVQLLQNLTQQRQHLKDLPNKTMMDILAEVPKKVFEEVLLSALQADMASAFQTPEQLQLLLVALERFPQTLQPKKVKKLLGSSKIINDDNIGQLTHLLKMAARSAKKECALPPLALDLLKLSLREDSFQLFWNKAVVEGMLKEHWGPTHFVSFRLLGSALPLLSVYQLREVLSGEVMKQYGDHVVSAQKQDHFKLAPEMDTYVSNFLAGCQDTEKQLAVMVGFTSLVNQGYPVVPSVWRVVQHLQPAALRNYVAWLRSTFLRPRVDELLNFTSHKQMERKEELKEPPQFRLRKWIVARLVSIVDNNHVKKDEQLIMDIARFVFFHTFFSVKKACANIPETEEKLHIPLDGKTRALMVTSFFGLLLSVHNLPLADESVAPQKRPTGVTSDGSLWLERLVQYAQDLLDKPALVRPVHTLSEEQRQAWDSMLESVACLKKKGGKGHSAENAAFRQLFLLIGMHLFKAPDELVDIMKDLQRCVDEAQEKTAKKNREKAGKRGEAEPQWVEVMVDILLSLLSQPSRHIRQVCKSVFASICPHVNAAALTAILDALEPDEDAEGDGPVLVLDDAEAAEKMETENDVEEDMENESDGTSDEEDDDSDGAVEEEVDQNFKAELMKVLQKKNALAAEKDSSEDDLDDDTMMELDKSLSALFSEQQKKVLARKDTVAKMRKKKTLLFDFKIKVLDLVEVFVSRQADNPLVLDLLEPLLSLIERGMALGNEQQGQEFLRRAADIFKNQLCRSKGYCKTAQDRQEELHFLLNKLMTKMQKLSESSVGLYYFSAALYVVKVLRGAPSGESVDGALVSGVAPDLRFMGNVDVEQVAGIFREALGHFMSRRKSPLTTQMFTDLFARFPVLCVKLLNATVQHIASGIREHQQGQACVLLLRAMQNRDVQKLMSGVPWLHLCTKVVAQLTAAFKLQGQMENKALQEKTVKALELCRLLVKLIQLQKLSVDLEALKSALQLLPEVFAFKKTGKLEDTYWTVMRHFGVTKPTMEKIKPGKDGGQQPPQRPAKKQKGFLPESKKKKKRPQPVLEPAADTSSAPMTDNARVKKGQGKTNNKKKSKRKADGTPASQPSPAKKSKMQNDKSVKKKKKNKQTKD
ncbi:myb-binding protein 1A-like protein isoform X1 [Syngnathus typhle]|uniref:myb-binding protein 1A-like protein isoform X1 n=1 Tax=Syngnathus typhle TaxID=161592 RepID=UPI002A69E4F4|nr:myb-binding protein 1A-like protein isoform X1 [Syngnathus typhle]